MTTCWEEETPTTHPSSAASPDSPDGGRYVTGQHEKIGQREKHGIKTIKRGLMFNIFVFFSLDDYNRLVTLCNGTTEGFIQRGIMDRGNMSLPTMNDVRSCLGIRDFDTSPYYTNSSSSFR